MKNKTLGTCKIRLFVLFSGILMLLLLSGCANMGTEIELDGDKFSGTRVMNVSFDLDELTTKLPGGLTDLDGLIDASIPQEMTYEHGETANGEAVYIFKLEFESQEDYVRKIRNLVNKVPEVDFSYSTGIFTRGVTFTENFESRELFGWLDKVIIENGLSVGSQTYTSEKFWNQTGVKVVLDGETYSCEGGKVNISSGGQSVVTGIDIATVIKANGEIERVMQVMMPTTVDSKQIQLIDNFFTENVLPSDNWSRRPRGGVLTYKVEFKVSGPDKLAEYMRELTNKDSTATFGSVADKSQPLAQSTELDESLDFSYFGGEKPVNVTYSVTSRRPRCPRA